MEVIYKSKYHVIEYSPETQTMSNYWLDESNNLDAVSYKQEVLVWLDMYAKKKPEFLFTDLTNFTYTISPEEQEWASIETQFFYSEDECKKHAFIVSDDFFSQLSVEQGIENTMDKSIELKVQYFQSKEKACMWLYNKTQVN
ncbi:hypothetical protein [Sediminitomix flava]|uniref:SpoIIAA-like protein n=1 Tax=Sediminitomix flava TaxID=379075 RepID=A0A315Z0R6_SEDFL|nr:hypothetical protein [Sediminitomix flava]PWJ36014.1 hypothetical protein BC781_10928 [Sediminitomix flava]